MPDEQNKSAVGFYDWNPAEAPYKVYDANGNLIESSAPITQEVIMSSQTPNAAEKLAQSTSFVPGPWKVIKTGGKAGWSRSVVNAETLENVCHNANEANARLIAAAPTYYEGCKDLPQIQDGEPTADYDKRVLVWFYCNAGKIHAANNAALASVEAL